MPRIERTGIKGVGRGWAVRLRTWRFRVWICRNGIEFSWNINKFRGRHFHWWRRSAKIAHEARQKMFWDTQWDYERKFYQRLGSPQDWIDRECTKERQGGKP